MAYLKFNSLLLFLFILLAGHLNAAQLLNISGKVEVRRQGSADWSRVKGSARIQPGDEVKTRWRSRVQVLFEDGSRVEIGPSSFYVLNEDGGAGKVNTSMKLKFGWMKAWVKKLVKRKFSVRTPTAVCAVRGTEFVIEVKGNKTSIDLFRGLLSVGDGKGNETMLNAGQRLTVDESGLGRPMSRETFRTQTREESRQALKREVSLNMTKEQVQAAASEEIKLAEYQQGKSMIDVFGKRVRLEQYIMRPETNQFKLVLLNDRVDRFDYFYWIGTFNRDLPPDLSIPLSQISGCLGQACMYHLTDSEKFWSSIVDYMHEDKRGGHQVNLSGIWKTLFDYITLTVNDTVIEQFEPYNAMEGVTDNIIGQDTVNDKFGWKFRYITDDGDLSAWRTSELYYIDPKDNISHPDGDDMSHTRMRKAYGDTGVNWLEYNSYFISDEGKIALSSEYSKDPDKWNFEMAITSNLFGGRKIDLVAEPTTLRESGLIK